MVDYNELEKYVYLLVAFGFLWGIFTVWWIGNTWWFNAPHTKPLHKLMFSVPFLKSFNCIFLSLLASTCFEGTSYQYWGLAMTTTFTLYNTFIYISLVLISKGFCITRDMLHRSEIGEISMTIGAVYLGYSAYMIEPSRLTLLLLIMILSLFYITVKFTNQNITALRIQHSSMLQSNIAVLIPPVAKKLSMMRNYLKILYFYFISQLFHNIVFVYGLPNLIEVSWNYFFGIDLFRETCEILAIFMIFVIFRSKDQGQFFAIPEVGFNSYVAPLATFYSVEVPIGNQVSNVDRKAPIVIYCPQQFDTERPYNNLMIGIPMTEVATTYQPLQQDHSQLDELRQPLLN
jgi:hypothetical protein